MRELGFSETSSEVSSIASTVILSDLDFSDDESIIDSPLQKTLAVVDTRFLRINALRNDFQEAMGSQKNVYGLISLGKSLCDDEYFFSAFIVWLLDRNIDPQQLIRSGLLHYFFVHHYVMLVGEEDVSDNPLKKTYALLSEISLKHQGVQSLLGLAKKTFCGVRGTKFNQESSGKFISLNLLYDEFSTDKKILNFCYVGYNLELVSVYETLQLPTFHYLRENARAIYDLFGFSFLELLDLKDPLDEAVFMQLKAEDPVGMLDVFCDKASTHELTVHQVKNIFPRITDLFSALSYDAFLNLLSKNPLFLTCVIHQPSLLQKIPAALVKKNLNLLLNKNDVYADIFSLTRILLALQSMSLRYDAVFIAAMKNNLFEKAFCSEEGDYLGMVHSFEVFSGEAFCREKLNSFRDKLISKIKEGCSYHELLVLRNSFFIQCYLIERVYPALFLDSPYLLDDSVYTLPSFYIQTRWHQRNLHQDFLLQPLLEDCKTAFRVQVELAVVRILFSLLRTTRDESLILFVVKHFSKNLERHLLLAIKIICLKGDITLTSLRHLFSAIPTTRFPESQCVNGVSFMRHPHIYAPAHIFLALKWIQVSLGEAYLQKTQSLIKLFSEVSRQLNRLPNALIDCIRNCANGMHASNSMPDFKNALINLVSHVERGYIEFYDLLPKKQCEKRSREETAHNDEPAAQRSAIP